MRLRFAALYIVILSLEVDNDRIATGYEDARHQYIGGYSELLK